MTGMLLPVLTTEVPVVTLLPEEGTAACVLTWLTWKPICAPAELYPVKRTSWHRVEG